MFYNKPIRRPGVNRLSHTIFAHDKTREYERFADGLKIAATQLPRDKAA
jgi:hypothetical protein